MAQWNHPYHSAHASQSSSISDSSIISYVNAIYYPNWRVYKGQSPSTLNPGFVSHVFYAFAWPNDNGTVSLSDEYADHQIEVDGTHGCMNALVALKAQHPHLKVVLSIGGGGQGSAKFAHAARSTFSRQIFAQSAKELIDLHGFDGVDIDWEHPSGPAEGAAYLALLTTLRTLLPSGSYILTSALPAGAWALQDIPLASVSQQLDFLNTMAYDFSGPWSARTGHHAQLFTSPSHHSATATEDSSGASGVQYLLNSHVPARKIVLGIPCYGRSFLHSAGPGHVYHGAAGDDGTFEYRALPRPGAREFVDTQRVAAWCEGGDGGWVSYDNVETVRVKAEWARRMKLGGLFYWTGTGDKVGEGRSLVECGYNELHQQ